MKRIRVVGLSVVSVFMISGLTALALAQGGSTHPEVLTHPEVTRPIRFAISKPLRQMAVAPKILRFPVESEPLLLPKGHVRQLSGVITLEKGASPEKDAALQLEPLGPVGLTLGLNLLGVGVGFHGYKVPDAPPDTNASIGDTQIVEWINVSFAVFDKTSGAYEAGPTLGNTFWASLGGACKTSNSGDIVAQWDKIAHRWVMMQPVFSNPYHICVAVSTTSDATGTYYEYDFPESATPGCPASSPCFPDYPKLGTFVNQVNNAYFMSDNLFNKTLTSFLGVQPCALERDKLLVGDATAQRICFFDNSNGTLFDDSFLPGDMDSLNLPRKGEDEVFIGSIDNYSPGNDVYLYKFHVDFAHPANSTFSGVNGNNPIAVASFVGLCNFGTTACIPQKGTASKLDALGDRLMYRLAYRHFVGPSASQNYESWLVTHSVANGGTGAARWYEFRDPLQSGNPRLYQQGTYAPDAAYRWMGSIAQDKLGNIALGYSRSGSTLYPDIYFTGRVPSDPLGTMETEAAIVDQNVATGSQQGTNNRWGDYSNMGIDNDGCTFVYSQQYYTVPDSTFAWSTRVATFKFPGCH